MVVSEVPIPADEKYWKEFIEEEQIGDFHTQNYGFNAAGDPIIFDYSDFNE